MPPFIPFSEGRIPPSRLEHAHNSSRRRKQSTFKSQTCFWLRTGRRGSLYGQRMTSLLLPPAVRLLCIPEHGEDLRQRFFFCHHLLTTQFHRYRSRGAAAAPPRSSLSATPFKLAHGITDFIVAQHLLAPPKRQHSAVLAKTNPITSVGARRRFQD